MPSMLSRRKCTAPDTMRQGPRRDPTPKKFLTLKPGTFLLCHGPCAVQFLRRPAPLGRLGSGRKTPERQSSAMWTAILLGLSLLAKIPVSLVLVWDYRYRWKAGKGGAETHHARSFEIAHAQTNFRTNYACANLCFVCFRFRVLFVDRCLLTLAVALYGHTR